MLSFACLLQYEKLACAVNSIHLMISVTSRDRGRLDVTFMIINLLISLNYVIQYQFCFNR